MKRVYPELEWLTVYSACSTASESAKPCTGMSGSVVKSADLILILAYDRAANIGTASKAATRPQPETFSSTVRTKVYVIQGVGLDRPSSDQTEPEVACGST